MMHVVIYVVGRQVQKVKMERDLLTLLYIEDILLFFLL